MFDSRPILALLWAIIGLAQIIKMGILQKVFHRTS